jgi:hypothetical protein
LQDAGRGFGASKSLSSNTTGSEGFNGTPLTQSLSVSSTGFTVSGSDFNGNTASETYVAWCWNAGGSTVTNTSGTISAQVRANTTSGFSIVTYTGTGSAATIGHGLGVAPSMIIVKKRGASGNNWGIYHASMDATPQNYYMPFTTSAKVLASDIWNNTAPTSTVFSIGTAGVSGEASTYVAYCFAPVAGYSAFGSYTGNGAADGAFIYTGFRPRYVLIKQTNTSSFNWCLVDTSRNPYNESNNLLFPNISDAETTTGFIDVLSNGFKARNASGYVNGSGSTYIYAAFAENPFKYSLAR